MGKSLSDMNLLSKITLINLLLALMAFVIGGVRIYRNFKSEVQRETDYTLREAFLQARRQLEAGVAIAEVEDELIRIVPMAQWRPADTLQVYADTIAMHPTLKRLEQFRRMTTVQTVKGQAYLFDVINVVIEQSDIRRITENILKDLFVVLGIILVVFSFFLSKWLLRPLQKTVEGIRHFDVRQSRPPVFGSTSTREFGQLNTFLTDMLQKAQMDYKALKEFSENASHEIQTPIAIAAGKLELLMESSDLSDQQMALVQDAQDALGRLSKLSEALLLLTKIDNREFKTQEPVHFSKVLEKEVAIFSELAEMRNLRMRSEISPDCYVAINPSLATVLIGNLLKNAIRHNIEQGWIAVTLTPQRLTVRNSGPEPPMPPEKLFDRFQKSERSGRSLGLGLAIVRQICTAHQWKVRYHYQEGVHDLSVDFQAGAGGSKIV